MTDIRGLAGMTPDEESGQFIDRTGCGPLPPVELTRSPSLDSEVDWSIDESPLGLAAHYRDASGITLEGRGVVTSTGNPKDRLGDAKPDLSLNPPAALLYMSLGFKDGARKYGPYNWRENKVRTRVYVAAALRHVNQYLDGEDIDPVSNVPHIAHALACLAIIADAKETGNLIDDRPVPGTAGEMIRRLTETK